MRKWLLTVISLTAFSSPVCAENLPVRTFSTHSEGVVMAAPDRAMFRGSAWVHAETVASGAAIVDQRLRAFMGALDELGVPDEAIQALDVISSPRYEYDKVEQRQVIRGYRIARPIKVRLDRLSLTGEVIQAAIDARLNELEPLAPFSSREDALRRDALAMAIHDASTRAESAAAAGGFAIGRVLQVEVLGGGTVFEPMHAMAMAGHRATEQKSSAVAITPGEIEIKARVRVVYEIVGGTQDPSALIQTTETQAVESSKVVREADPRDKW